MFLSNPVKYLLVICCFAVLLSACGSTQKSSDQPKGLQLDARSEFPFPTKEPENYQALLTATSGAFIDKWFVARKGASWRIDFYDKGELSQTRFNSDAVYLLDHRRKIWVVSEGTSDIINELSDRFFKGKEYRKFEEIGRDGSIVKYKVTSPGGKGDVTVSVDEKTGVVMRQEFAAAGDGSVPFVYEVKDLKFDVDDSLFRVPDGFRKVAWEEYRSQKSDPK